MWDACGSRLGRPLVAVEDLGSDLLSELGLDLTYLCGMRVGRGLQGHSLPDQILDMISDQISD